MVKSLGDGMLLEFGAVPTAVAAAFELQQRIHPDNDKLGGAAVLALRIGANVADVTLDDVDVYGLRAPSQGSR